MTGQERIARATSFQPTDRVPKDLGGMASTGISAFAYPALVDALGLPPRRPRVHDTSQMLALPDPDVLDALGCDVVSVHWGVTNAFEQPDEWHPFDFGGRLHARVRDPELFRILPDGEITQPRWRSRMPPTSFVFDIDHAGQGLDYMAGGELPLLDLEALRRETAAKAPSDADVRRIRDLCRRVRASTDRAVFYNGPGHSTIAITGHGGIGVFPVICLLEPDYAHEYHEIRTQQTLSALEAVLPEIREYIDVLLLGGDDWGSQQTTFASPAVFEEYFLPYYSRMNALVHGIAPHVKTFIHTCGAVYDVLELIIRSGFDILNPVQWTAGGRTCREWKERCRDRIAMWGGGIDSQAVLPFGTVAEIEDHVHEVVGILADGSGYVFNSIHNILAEVEPDKIIAAYRAVERGYANELR
jgi:uroporphyrinogen decarboxylase